MLRSKEQQIVLNVSNYIKNKSANIKYRRFKSLCFCSQLFR